MTSRSQPVAGSTLLGADAHAPDARAEASEAARRVRAASQVTQPSAVWLALGGAWGGAGEDVSLAAAALEGLESVWPGAAAVTLFTRTAGLLGTEGEWREGPCLGVLALEGPGPTAFAVEELSGEEDRAGPEVAARLERPPEAGDVLVVWADAASLAAQPLLESLSRSLKPATLLGGGVSPPPGEAPGLSLAGRPCRSGIVGWHLPRALSPRVRTANACHPLTAPLDVTRARGHWIVGLGGRPALEVFREAAGPALGLDPARAARVLKLAVLDPEASAPDEPVALWNVVGFDARRSAFSVAQPVESGRRVMLVQLDAERARDDLNRAVGPLAAQESGPDWALYFSCRGRGASLFGMEGLESGLVERGLAGTAWLGTVADDQFAPGTTAPCEPRLLTHAGVLLAATWNPTGDGSDDELGCSR